MSKYQIIVGNIGTVYSGENEKESLKIFREYVSQSLHGFAYAGNEDVVILCDGEILKEFYGNKPERMGELD